MRKIMYHQYLPLLILMWADYARETRKKENIFIKSCCLFILGNRATKKGLLEFCRKLANEIKQIV